MALATKTNVPVAVRKTVSSDMSSPNRFSRLRATTTLSGKSLSPRSSLRLALPILAGPPRNAPTPAKAGILSAARCAGGSSGASLRSRVIVVAAKRRRLGSRALRRLGRNMARGPATFPPDRALRRLRDATPAARAFAALADSVSPLPDCRVGFTLPLRATRFACVNSIGRARAAPEPGFS